MRASVLKVRNMRLYNAILKVGALAAVSMQLVGCSKSGHSRSEGKITGKASDPPVELLAKWNPTNRYIYQLDMTLSTEIPRRTVTKMTQQEISFGQDYAVTVTNELSDGNYKLQLEILALQLEMALGDHLTINYDSENKVIVVVDENPLVNKLQKMVGTRYGYLLSPDNRVMKIDGLSVLSDRNLTNDLRGTMLNTFRRIFNQPHFKQFVELNVMPGKPVRIGETWASRHELSTGTLGGSVSLQVTNIFRGWQVRDNKKCALVEFNGAISPRPRVDTGPRVLTGGMETGSVFGRTWFDPASGLARETDLDHDLTLKSTTTRRVRGTNSTPQSYTSATREHINIKLVEIAPIEKQPSEPASN
jgi:Family of unknown function (DUF6263)